MKDDVVMKMLRQVAGEVSVKTPEMPWTVYRYRKAYESAMSMACSTRPQLAHSRANVSPSGTHG